MNKLSFAVLTEDGVFQIAKDVHKAWLFLTPPEPPFIAVLSSATMQHLVWRTPVTLSKELIYLRRGGDLFTIRPGALTLAVDAAKRIKARRSEETGKDAPLSPYAVNDRGLGRSAHGRLSPKAIKHMTAEDKTLFFELSPGEIWALGFLLVKNPPEPTQPEKLHINLSEA